MSSFLLTLVIFAIGITLNYALDNARIDSINSVINAHELDTESYILEEEFTEYMGGNKCEVMKDRIQSLKEEIHEVGFELSNYGAKSIFKKKDMDYLKRKYFLLELKFYHLITRINDNCGQVYVPILFFYEIDDDLSERQGYILDDISESHKKTVAVFSIDKDYKDEPLVTAFVKKFNVTTAPSIVIGNVKKTGITYGKEINETINNFTLSTQKNDLINTSLPAPSLSENLTLVVGKEVIN